MIKIFKMYENISFKEFFNLVYYWKNRKLTVLGSIYVTGKIYNAQKGSQQNAVCYQTSYKIHSTIECQISYFTGKYTRLYPSGGKEQYSYTSVMAGKEY